MKRNIFLSGVFVCIFVLLSCQTVFAQLVPLYENPVDPDDFYSTGDNPESVALGGLNGDGNLDLAVANSGTGNGTNTVSILLGNGDGTFQAATNVEAGSLPRSVAIGHLNEDEFLDLAVADSGPNFLIGYKQIKILHLDFKNSRYRLNLQKKKG